MKSLEKKQGLRDEGLLTSGNRRGALMKNNKIPAFQFYPSDWRSDPGVQSLSYHERGVWFEMLCMMHESSQRGKLILNGKAMPMDALAMALGLMKQDTEIVVEKLIEYGVASRNPKNSVIFSRRMVKDEHLRNVRKKCGELGGNPNLVNQKSTTHVNQKSTPSSSSSSSVHQDPHTPASGGLASQQSPQPIPQQKQTPRETRTSHRDLRTNPRAIYKRQQDQEARSTFQKLTEQEKAMKPEDIYDPDRDGKISEELKKCRKALSSSLSPM